MKEIFYNSQTLSPVDDEVRAMFSEYRKKDVKSMFFYFCIFTSLWSGAALAMLLYHRAWNHLAEFLLAVTCAMLHWLVLLIGRKVEINMQGIYVSLYLVI